MDMCRLVSSRSIDPHTQHGCVVVAPDNTVLATGYNSPPRGCDDSKVPLTRPEKYDWFVHSEAAAIANAAKHGVRIDGSTFYITGWPCEQCSRLIINAGGVKIIYGDVKSKCISDINESISKSMFNQSGIIIEKFRGSV